MGKKKETTKKIESNSRKLKREAKEKKHYLVTILAYYTINAKDQKDAEAVALTEYRKEIKKNVLKPIFEVEEI